MKKTYILLFLIILIAGIFRFWGLSNTPPSLYWDEVSQGFNSYSILKTAHDEHNEFLPITTLKAFGDYKAPVYIYLDVPFIAVFGETPLGVRFPSALLGTLTVLAAFGLVFELFKNHKHRHVLALLTAFFLNISPWHVQLSRAAYEGNVATFFTVLGVYLFLLAKNRNFSWLILSGLSFVLGFYAFNVQRVFIPLIVVTLAVMYFKDIFVRKRLAILIVSSVLAIILLTPFLLYLRTPESRLRFNEVNIFSDTTVIENSNTLIKEANNSLVSRVVDNRRVLFTLDYLKHYFDFFNPGFLFFTGDVNPRFSMQGVGELYLWELPLLMLGAYMLIKYKKRESAFIFAWFILAPVVAATARETPHALRSETYVPTYEIIAAFGAYGLIMAAGKLKPLLRKACFAAFGIIVFLTVITTIHNYFVHFPALYSGEWQYGYKQAIAFTQSQESKYDLIAFTQTYGRPYIYLLFYGNISPETYWKTKQETRDQYGLYNVLAVGKYQFRTSLIQPSDSGKHVLYVGDPKQIPNNLKIIKTIDFLNGKPGFVFATN